MSVDNIPILNQERVAVASGEVSALGHVWHTPGYPRFIYGAYLILGIIFYGIAVSTAFGIILHILNNDTILTFRTVLFFCYVLINTIIGYGFMFCRNWLLVAFSSTLTLTGLLAIFFFISGATSSATASFTGIFIIVGILLFLFLTRRFLSGRYLEPKVVVPFVLLLLLSLLLTNLGVLH